jgi:hypothetical protein
MTVPLPRHPDLDYIKKQAKQLLAAHRDSNRQACQLWRRLGRFVDASDDEILGARLTLADAQYAVALHYGFASWAKLREEINSYPRSDEISLDAVRERSKAKLPRYAGAGVPLGVVCALNHEGVDIDIAEFLAVSGWAFSFGYKYGDISPAYMGVRGNPKQDGPLEVFAFLPLSLGFDYELARTAEPDTVWDFVRKYVAAGTPIVSEHFDGGLITAYREREGNRQVFFDGTVFPGWWDVDKLNPYAVYVLKKGGHTLPEDRIRSTALRRAVAKGRAHEREGAPQGLAALRAYLADVADGEKDFHDMDEWFCWAAFERLMARKCAQLWLRSCAKCYDASVNSQLREAADCYGEAFEHYERYRSAVQDGFPPRATLRERARTPERIAVITPVLASGIAAEERGLQHLAKAVEAIG